MILVLAEQINGSFKKKTFEVLQYAATIAQKNKDKVVALVLGSAQEDAMQALGAYGAQEVWHVNDARFDSFSAKAFAKAIQQIATQHNATMLIAPHDVCGKAVAPRVAAVMQAGMVAGAVAYPTYDNGFELQKSVFSGKAFAFVNLIRDIKVLAITPNSFEINANGSDCATESVSGSQV